MICLLKRRRKELSNLEKQRRMTKSIKRKLRKPIACVLNDDEKGSPISKVTEEHRILQHPTCPMKPPESRKRPKIRLHLSKRLARIKIVHSECCPAKTAIRHSARLRDVIRLSSACPLISSDSGGLNGAWQHRETKM